MGHLSIQSLHVTLPRVRIGRTAANTSCCCPAGVVGAALETRVDAVACEISLLALLATEPLDLLANPRNDEDIEDNKGDEL